MQLNYSMLNEFQFSQWRLSKIVKETILEKAKFMLILQTIKPKFTFSNFFSLHMGKYILRSIFSETLVIFDDMNLRVNII
jgi:hypothetical protein